MCGKTILWSPFITSIQWNYCMNMDPFLACMRHCEQSRATMKTFNQGWLVRADMAALWEIIMKGVLRNNRVFFNQTPEQLFFFFGLNEYIDTIINDQINSHSNQEIANEHSVSTRGTPQGCFLSPPFDVKTVLTLQVRFLKSSSKR